MLGEKDTIKAEFLFILNLFHHFAIVMARGRIALWVVIRNVQNAKFHECLLGRARGEKFSGNNVGKVRELQGQAEPEMNRCLLTHDPD